MDSTQAFHANVNLILLPLWMLSGALFPTAATDASRATNLAVTAGFCVLSFATSGAIVNRRTNKPAA